MIKVIAAVLIREGRLLIAQRPASDALAGKWELPGGKLEPGETPEECLTREIAEELDIYVTVDGFCCSSDHQYVDRSIELIAYFVTFTRGDIQLKVHDQFAWVTSSEIASYDLAPADIPIIEELKRRAMF